jgi:hypothetical protein
LKKDYSLLSKRNLIRNLSNIPGWRTNRKIVVIESDDWGAIRMVSKEILDNLINAGVPISQCRFNNNDSLAAEDDLSSLFEVLHSVKDKNGNSALFTAVSVVANPDFDKIEQNGFQKYFYEPFTETLKKYPGHAGSFNLWKEGIKNRLFVPQFHGREHLNVTAWLKALRNGNQDTLLAFKHKVYGITPRDFHGNVSFQAAFDIEDITEIDYHKDVIKQGLELFEKLFGYKATYFIPTNGPFNNHLEIVAAEYGIKYMGTSKIQLEPIGQGRTRKVFHRIGQKNDSGQTYITRNCVFEPNDKSQNWIDSCLKEIEIAFRWGKPAVISSHRVNFVGHINPSNRTNGLKQLKILLNEIVKHWTNVEFLTTDQLGDLITEQNFLN